MWPKGWMLPTHWPRRALICQHPLFHCGLRIIRPGWFGECLQREECCLYRMQNRICKTRSRVTCTPAMEALGKQERFILFSWDNVSWLPFYCSVEEEINIWSWGDSLAIFSSKIFLLIFGKKQQKVELPRRGKITQTKDSLGAGLDHSPE